MLGQHTPGKISFLLSQTWMIKLFDQAKLLPVKTWNISYIYPMTDCLQAWIEMQRLTLAFDYEIEISDSRHVVNITAEPYLIFTLHFVYWTRQSKSWWRFSCLGWTNEVASKSLLLLALSHKGTHLCRVIARTVRVTYLSTWSKYNEISWLELRNITPRNKCCK